MGHSNLIILFTTTTSMYQKIYFKPEVKNNHKSLKVSTKLPIFNLSICISVYRYVVQFSKTK